MSSKKVIAAGDCFRFANQTAMKRHGDDPEAKVVHGVVSPKWHHRPYVHAWVEAKGRVFDQQTQLMRPDGIPKDKFHKMYNVSSRTSYSPEEATVNTLRHRNHGPWDTSLEQEVEKKRKMDKSFSWNEIFEKAREKIPGGLSSGKTDADFDPKALAEGVEVEMEHTTDSAIAREIARDHLTEDPKYYQKLKEIEKAFKIGAMTQKEKAPSMTAPEGSDPIEHHQGAAKFYSEMEGKYPEHKEKMQWMGNFHLDKLADLRRSFRGGDPEYAQFKKEEAEQEAKDSGELDDLNNSFQKAAEGEEGEFRGGDPEELQFKKEEKEREMKESGEWEEKQQEAAEQEELADPSEQEDAIQAEEDAEAEKSLTVLEEMMQKAGLLSYPEIGQQVSPVGTGDYIPKDRQGEPRDPLTFRGTKQPWQEVGPIRPGKNQFKPWSEVIGLARIHAPSGPPVGWQNIREESLAERGKSPTPGPMKPGEVPVAKAQGKNLYEPRSKEDEPQHQFTAGPDEQGQVLEPSGQYQEQDLEGVELIRTAEEAERILQMVPKMDQQMLLHVDKKIWGDQAGFSEWADEPYIRNAVEGDLMDIIDKEETEQMQEMGFGEEESEEEPESDASTY